MDMTGIGHGCGVFGRATILAGRTGLAFFHDRRLPNISGLCYACVEHPSGSWDTFWLPWTRIESESALARFRAPV